MAVLIMDRFLSCTGRDNLGSVCETRDYKLGLEVGTHQGEYAEKLLQQWPGRLYCLDPWAIPAGYEHQAQFLDASKDRESDRLICEKRLEPYADRCLLFPMTTQQAVKTPLHSNVYDFVYLDGDHSCEGLAEDLLTWFPRIRPGGLIAGHDVIMPNAAGQPWDWAPGIQKAIAQWFANIQVPEIRINLIVDENPFASWSWAVEVSEEIAMIDREGNLAPRMLK